jgi:predicted dehydrogenase
MPLARSRRALMFAMSDRTTPPPVVHTVIVGYGHAGRDLHGRALRELDRSMARGWAARSVHVVDPVRPVDADAVGWVPRVEDLPRLPVDRTMFHITVPPDRHVAAVHAILAAGARHALVEKPVAPTAAIGRDLFARCEHAGLNLVPVGVWTASRTTAAVRRLLPTTTDGSSLWMEQSKDRSAVTLASDSHRSALDVEAPHQVLLALSLLGPPDRLVSAQVRPLHRAGRTIQDMGGCRLVLRHHGGSLSELVSHLDTPPRRRSLTVRAHGVTVHARYPGSADHTQGSVWTTGCLPRRVPDRPLTECIAAAYRQMTGAPCARVDREVHIQTLEVIDAARSAVSR